VKAARCIIRFLRGYFQRRTAGAKEPAVVLHAFFYRLGYWLRHQENSVLSTKK
jgi:hypothetical protein